MPTYDYRCNACGYTFELFQSMSAAVKRKCPECGKNKLERLIGMGAGVLFKGGGFYQTDYRSESYKQAEAKDQKASEPSSKEDAKANAKPTSKKPSPGSSPSKGSKPKQG